MPLGKTAVFYADILSIQSFNNLLFNEFASATMTLQCLKEIKNSLGFIQQPEYVLYLDNLDFVLQLFKREHYQPTPRIARVD